MQKFFVALALFLLPSITLAVGFAKQSIFLSKESVAEGDSVLIYVVLSNDTGQPFAGQLELYDEDGVIGTTSVTLAAGNTETVPTPWHPVAGTHSVNASLESSDGQQILESENATFVIAPKAQPSAVPQSIVTTSAVDSSLPLEQSLANLSPSIARDTQPIFTAVDAGRNTAATTLDQGITWANAQKTASSSAVALPATGLSYLLSALRYSIANIGVFYPAIALLFFLFLWWLWRRMCGRPRHSFRVPR